MKEIKIKPSLPPDAFERILRWCGTHTRWFGFVCEAPLPREMEELAKHIFSIRDVDEWPGTKLLDAKVPRYRFRCDPESISALVSCQSFFFPKAHVRSDPSLRGPEDLHFINPYGAVLFASILHEQDFWLELDDHQLLSFQEMFPHEHDAHLGRNYLEIALLHERVHAVKKAVLPILEGTKFEIEPIDDGAFAVQHPELPSKWRIIFDVDVGNGTPEAFEITLATWRMDQHFNVYSLPYDDEPGGYPPRVDADFVIDYAVRNLSALLNGEEIARILFSPDGKWMQSSLHSVSDKNDPQDFDPGFPEPTKCKAVFFSWSEMREWEEVVWVGGKPKS